MSVVTKKGSICKLVDSVEIAAVTKKEKSTYERMVSQGAEFYIVLREDGEKHFLCAPVLDKKIRHSINIIINGKPHYIGYLDFFSVPTCWLRNDKVFVTNTFGYIDQIYERRKAHNMEVNARNQKKKQRKREDKRLGKEWRAMLKSECPKEEAPTTVKWNMAHPLQGGRTSPK